MTKKLFLILCFTFVAEIFYAQDQKYPETVIIKIFESLVNTGADDTDTKIVTITPDNGIETKRLLLVQFNRLDYIQNFTSNQLKIKTEIQIWRNTGFSVKTSNIIMVTAGLVLTTYMLEKN